MRYAVQSVGVNLVGNLILIPCSAVRLRPCRAAARHRAVASTVNVWMLYATLTKRGHFVARRAAEAPRSRGSRSPRSLMGVAVFGFAPAARPLAHRLASGSAGAALVALVGGGVAVYGVACFLTGAFALDDVKILLKRRAREA